MFERHIVPLLAGNPRLLEIGPDAVPSTYQRLAPAGLPWETADVAGFRPDEAAITHVMPNEYEVPIADGSFDVVLAGQVIEHVREVWRWVDELARIVRPGGHVALVSPISWPYHEAPVDCWRIYPEGMRALCGHAGLEVLHCESASLEPAPSRRTYPGPTASGRALALKRLLGWPLPVAVDLVTIARRPS